MTKAEKAFAGRRINKTESDRQLLVHMLKLIEEQEEYNEGAIIKKLGISAAQMARNKNYLYESLVDAIAQMSQGDEPVGEVRKLLSHADILFKKRLFKACEKKLTKALLIAREAELFSYYTEISNSLVQLKEIQGDSSWLTDNAMEYRLLEDKTLQQQIQLQQLKGYKMDRLFSLHQLYGSPAEINKMHGDGSALIAELMSITNVEGQSKTAQLQYYNYLAFVLYVFGQTGEALKTTRKAISLFENEVLFTQQHYRLYLHGINNYLLLGMSDLRKAEVNRMLGLLKQCAADFEKIDYIKTNALARYYHFWLLSQFSFGSIKKALPLLQEVERWLSTHPEELVDQVNYTKGIEFLAASACFLAGDYKKAVAYTQKIINRKLLNYDYHIARINFLILHYEFGNMELLESLIRSLRRHYKTEHPFKAIALCICDYLKKAISVADKSGQKATFVLMKNALEAIYADPVTQLQIANFEHRSALIFDEWCTRRINGNGQR